MVFLCRQLRVICFEYWNKLSRCLGNTNAFFHKNFEPLIGGPCFWRKDCSCVGFKCFKRLWEFLHFSSDVKEKRAQQKIWFPWECICFNCIGSYFRITLKYGCPLISIVVGWMHWEILMGVVKLNQIGFTSSLVHD